MKYFIFYAVLACCPGVAFVASLHSQLQRLLLFLVPMIMVLWERTSINFFSFESYRGTSRGMEISLVYLLAFCLLLSRWLISHRLRFSAPGFWCYSLYCFSAWIAWPHATVSIYSWLEIWKMIMMGMVFLAIYNEIVATGDVYPVILGFIGVVWINFLTCMYQRYGLGGYQVSGIFPHQNSMAMFNTLLGPLFFAAWLLHPNKRFAWLCGGTFMIAGLGVFLSLSRGALAAFPFGCACTLPFVVLKRKWTLRKTKIFALLSVGAVLGIVICLPRMIERFETAPEGSGETRKDMAALAFTIMRDHPGGIGPNNWGEVVKDPEYSRFYYDLRDRKYPYKETDSGGGIVETIYLVTGTEFGYFGLAMLILLFMWYLYLAFKAIKLYKNTIYAFIPIGLMGGFLSNYLQSILEWVLKQAINFTTLMICYAILAALITKRNEIRQVIREV